MASFAAKEIISSGTPTVSRHSRSCAELSGKYRHLATGRLAVFVVTAKLTATRQFSCLPTCPQYWHATPTECVPFFTNPVSSTTQATTGHPPVVAPRAYSRARCSTATSLHGASATTWCNDWWVRCTSWAPVARPSVRHCCARREAASPCNKPSGAPPDPRALQLAPGCRDKPQSVSVAHLAASSWRS
jgi:hypothetical protein